MNFLSISELTNKAKTAFKRFPVTLLWAIVGTSFTMYIVQDGDLFETYASAFLTFTLGISWLIGTQFLIEQFDRRKALVHLKWIPLGLLLVFYWHLPEGSQLEKTPKFLIRFSLYFLAGHLFVLVAPFMIKWHKAAYWNYLKSMAMAIGRSAFFSGVLFLGLVLALVAIESLFEFKIHDERYGQLFVFCLGIVNTWIYLSDFPRNVHSDTSIEFQRPLEVFVKYILIPLVILYVVILYAYGLKIVLQWELPKGWVSYLVTALAFLGFIVQVIINPIQKTIGSWTINRFFPWFYILLLPLIILLFVAIGRRIADYGITENRYFVLVLAFWILTMALYLLISKRKSLIILPISLCAIALLSSFGFWGVFSVSLNSQLRQFEYVFEEVNAQNMMASRKQFEQLKSIIGYLGQRESVTRLNDITGIDLQKTSNDSTHVRPETNRRQNFDSQKVLNALGVTIDPEDKEYDEPHGVQYAYYADRRGSHNYDIRNYDYFSDVQFNDQINTRTEIGDFIVRYNSDLVELHLIDKNDSTRALTIPLRKKLLDLSTHGTTIEPTDEEEMTLEVISDDVLAKLIFKELNYSIQRDSVGVSHSRAFLFIKKW